MAYELKTKINDASVTTFLEGIEDEQKRNDCYEIAKIMQDASGFEPKMWGASIVGFDSYHYKYDSGHEGDMALISFSPRKANITLYLSAYIVQNKTLMAPLGKHKTGKGCLYINKLSDVDKDIFKDLIKKSLENLKSYKK